MAKEVKVPKPLQKMTATLDHTDEVETIHSGDVPSLLAEARKCGIRLALSPQDIGQLSRASKMLEDGNDA